MSDELNNNFEARKPHSVNEVARRKAADHHRRRLERARLDEQFGVGSQPPAEKVYLQIAERMGEKDA